MIEITFIEIVLFAWAVLATAAAFKYREQAQVGKRILQVFIENGDAREQILKAHDEFVKGQS
jgi:hypothetical protein